MKGRLQTILGLLIIGVFVFAIGKSIYRSIFEKPEVTIMKSASISSPIKNALFWYEEELEKTSGPTMNSKLSAEESNFVNPLFDYLRKAGMTNEKIKTMSEKATAEMIALDAYRGSEPDVWEIAKEKGNPYIFKVTIMSASPLSRSNDLGSATYLFSLCNVTDKSVIWEAKSTRSAGFFGGMPDSEKNIEVLEKNLKESKIIQ